MKIPSLKLKGWFTDHLAAGIGVLTICTMVAILVVYDGRPYSDWPLPITLNATVSVFVTILYMSLAIPPSSCLAQLKWNIFHSRERPYLDLMQLDEASRGVFGSLKYLLHSWPRPTSKAGVLAAALLVLITAIGPFSQQVISVATTSQPSYPLKGTEQLWSSTLPVLVQDVGDTAASAIYDGLFNNMGSFNVSPQNCVNANCSWDTYTTLAIRAECVDITEHLVVGARFGNGSNSTAQIRATLPNGHRLKFSVPWQLRQPGFPGATNLSSIFYPITLPRMGNVLLYSTLIHIPRISAESNRTTATMRALKNISATECVLQTIARPLTASSVNGVFIEQPIGADIANNSDYAIWTSPYTIWYNESGLAGSDAFHEIVATRNLPRDNITYDVPAEYTRAGSDPNGERQIEYDLVSNQRVMSGVALQLANNFEGSTDPYNFNRCEAGQMYTGQGGPIYPSRETNLSWGCVSPPTAFSVISRLLTNDSLPTHLYGEVPALPAVQSVFERIANSLTVAMRNDISSTKPALGTRQVAQISYLVDWRWISVPVGLCALVWILLIMVALDTNRKRMPVWKGSILPVAIHGLDDSGRARLRSARTLKDMEAQSREFRARLAEYLAPPTLPVHVRRENHMENSFFVQSTSRIHRHILSSNAQ